MPREKNKRLQNEVYRLWTFDCNDSRSGDPYKRFWKALDKKFGKGNWYAFNIEGFAEDLKKEVSDFCKFCGLKNAIVLNDPVFDDVCYMTGLLVIKKRKGVH